MRVVLMYGGGDDGPAGWPPDMSGDGHTFMERDPSVRGDDPERDTERLVRMAQDRPVHLVGWSYGGIAALLAAQRVPEQVRSLTLFEPSCADLAREAASGRSFRRALEPAYRTRTDRAFLAAFSAATGSPVPDDPAEALALARRWRATPPPWATAIPRGRLSVPTLVVTGGWADYFEDIARALVTDGARHHVLHGYGHWVPGHPAAAGLLHEFVATHER